MKIVSSEAMALIDRRSQAEFAIPSLVLMEDAGVKSWSILRREVWGGRRPRGRIVAAGGRGNNGGDAFVMARQAAVEGLRPITIVLAGGRPDPTTDPGRNLAACEALGVEIADWPVQQELVLSRVTDAAWLLDVISGTGLRGPLRPPAGDLVRAINQSPARKVALDVPSGVGDGFRQDYPAVRADVTLTMGLPKLCLYLPRARSLCGRIIVVPVGFPPALVEDESIAGELLSTGAWKQIAPPVPVDTHKNRRGHLAVFAGSPGTTGAAVLCASSAARARVGLVTVFADREAYPVIAPRLTSIMCRPWDSSRPDREWDPSRYTAFLVGPGWGTGGDRAAWLETLLPLSIPGVMDADALTLLGTMAASRKVDLGGRWVLTPHPAEFSRLTGAARDAVLDDPVGHALAASGRFNAVVVLKGHTTVIANPDGRYWILDGANPTLATGGSGDVLAGLIAGGMAGGLPALGAARFGVSLHARLGAIAARRRGWFLAEDLVPLVSSVLWK